MLKEVWRFAKSEEKYREEGIDQQLYEPNILNIEWHLGFSNFSSRKVERFLDCFCDVFVCFIQLHLHAF